MDIGEKKKERVVDPDFLPIEPDEQPEERPEPVVVPEKEPAEVRRAQR